MCELMGMSFAKPIVANVSIKAFSLRSEENTDGWGLAWYPDRSLAMVKQPLRMAVQQTQFLDSYPGLLSSIYVAHVRHRTTGSIPTHADTHPFARELGGREYCFAHNGTLTGEFWQKPLGRFRPVGNTDSEFLFCLLLAELDDFAQLTPELDDVRRLGPLADGKPAQKPVQATTEKQWRWLHKLLLRLNDFGRLNCLLTDGDRLLAYHDKNGWKGLTYRNVFLHQETEHYLADSTLKVNLQSNLVNHGCVVATNPLSVEGWDRFLPGEMKLFHQGSVTFSSRPGLHETNGTDRAEPKQNVVLASPVVTG